jgi:hypothetical protein
MPKSSTAEKILTSLKGLRDHMHTGEEPLFSIPAIWHGGQEKRGMPCDVVLTNQRLLGYVFVTFPRQRLFLEDFALRTITIVSLRHRTFEPLFNELLVSDGQRKVYIHAPRKKIENLYQALRAAIEEYAPATQTSFEGGEEVVASGEHVRPVFGRQEIHRAFERSPLAITLLFTGGLLLEIIGAVLWVLTQNIQAGLPLFIAGFIAVLTAFMIRRRQH